MRMPRIKEPGEACYHVISRIVDRQMLFNVNEKERFRSTMGLQRDSRGCMCSTTPSWITTYGHLDLSYMRNQMAKLSVVPEKAKKEAA